LLPDTERANFNFTMPELIIIMPLVDAQRQQISIDLRTWITRISEWHFPKKTTSERPFVADPDRTDEDHNEWDRATVMRHAKRLIDHGLIIRPPEGRRKQPWRVSRRAMNLVNALAASNLPQRRDNSY